MLTKLTAALVAGCALIGQANAFEFNHEQATHTFALAVLAEKSCPGMKIDSPKVSTIFNEARVDPSSLDTKALEAEVRKLVDGGLDRSQLCALARDPAMPIHLMLDID